MKVKSRVAPLSKKPNPTKAKTIEQTKTILNSQKNKTEILNRLVLGMYMEIHKSTDFNNPNK